MLSKERFKGLPTKAVLIGASFLALAGSVSCNSQVATQETATPTPSTATGAPKPTERPASAPEELLAKHNARLIELSRIFKEDRRYPREEVEQWLKTAGITWDTLTVHGLPYAFNVITKDMDGKSIPEAVVAFGTKIKVRYPAYIQTSPTHSFLEFDQLEEARKAEVGHVELWTNVQVSDLRGAFGINVDGSHIQELSPK